MQFLNEAGFTVVHALLITFNAWNCEWCYDDTYSNVHWNMAVEV